MGNEIHVYVPHYAGVHDNQAYAQELQMYEHGHERDEERVIVHAPDSTSRVTMMTLADLVGQGLVGWTLYRLVKEQNSTNMVPEEIQAGNKPGWLERIVNLGTRRIHPLFKDVQVGGQTISFEVIRT